MYEVKRVTGGGAPIAAVGATFYEDGFLKHHFAGNISPEAVLGISVMFPGLCVASSTDVWACERVNGKTVSPAPLDDLKSLIRWVLFAFL